MISPGLDFDDYVVNIHLNVPSQLVIEDFIHRSLIYTPCIILKSEWHHLIAIQPLVCDKGSMDLVMFSHWD